jgi:predicted anti-sigma-YlaC factor YlaD
MVGCEAFGVAVEMRLHGALDEAGRAPLEEHLAGCERCRAYETAARGAEAGMAAAARDAAGAVDWGRVDRRIRRRPSAPARVLGAAAACAAGVAGLVWLSTPAPLRAERLLRTTPSTVVLVVLVAFVAAYSGRRLTALVDRGEALVTWRHVVLANLVWARRMQWATAAIVAFLLYRALRGSAAGFDPAVFYGGLAIPAAAAWVYLRRVELPRAVREARDLGLDTGGGR